VSRRATSCRRRSRSHWHDESSSAARALEGWVWKIALRLAAGLRASSTKPVPERLDPAVPDVALDAPLAEAIRALSPRRRLFVFLRYFADLSYDEIAEACGVSRGTVAAALSQARSDLATALGEKAEAH
jgi:RNA polymerase sigma factor (sigma-70 family)